jgi:ATP-dependent exoDNAse (exonuclease V) alpha subunit
MTIEPQPKLGPGTLKREYEKGSDPKDVSSKTVTDKGQHYQRIRLRNLHHILSDPEQILKIVSAHHVTFMWGDVEAVVRRFIDDPLVAENISGRLKTSPELVILGEVSAQEEGVSETVYTTKTMLSHEASLVKKAVTLSAQESHPVSEALQTQAIERLNAQFSKRGGLSNDQKGALLHMLAPQQLATVVGYAGSGKTTVLRGAMEAWQNAGYQVYGLAPTGIAAQNLRDAGINSQVIHKFLWQYDQGRCQYKKNTVLILDEAGMVDVPHFDRLMKAVERLGIKLVMVGDGRQLQAVAPGDAFRLVTERVCPKTLQTVLRQEQPWQQQATELFGKGQSHQAISMYLEKGAFTFVEEPVVSLEKLPFIPPQDLLQVYSQAKRVSGTLYQYISQNASSYSDHIDAPLHQSWKERRLQCAESIFERLEDCRPFMAQEGFDGQGFARDLLSLAHKSVTEQAIQDLMAQLHLPQSSLRPACEVRHSAKESLIAAWAQSMKLHPQDSHLILTYTQRDSKDLNGRARAFMKSEGLLQGADHRFTIHKETRDAFGALKIEKETREFARGDRLLFLKNKDAIKNGMIGTIIHIEKDAITLKIDGHQDPFVFNPNLYRHFDYGYAPTIHKSQGITVDRAFVLATYQMFKNLAYVALTRHRKDVKIFGSRLDFWRDEIVTVMAKGHHKLSSFDYISEAKAHALLKNTELALEKSLRRLGERAYGVMAVTKEAWHRMSESFLGRRPLPVYGTLPIALTESSRGKLMEQQKLSQHTLSQEKTVMAIKPQRPSILHYYRSDDVQSSLNASHIEALFKSHMHGWVENPILHKQGNTLRFGKSGGFVVNRDTGLWYNHYDGRKGNVFQYIVDSKNLSYKEAVAWVGQWAQAPTSLYEGRALECSMREHRQLVRETQDKERLTKACLQAQKMFEHSKPMAGTPAQAYLHNHRALSTAESPHIRFHNSLRTEGKSTPALLAFARNPQGQITAYQAIYLDAHTNGKAQHLEASKKPHGVLKGSAVTLQEDKEGKGMTYIAEGLETALSLKEAGIKGEILASLGQSNMGALSPKGHTVVLVGDYDGDNHPRTHSTLFKIAQSYKSKGHKVHTVYPTTEGKQKLDFNDLLQQKGPQSIQEAFASIETTIHAPTPLLSHKQTNPIQEEVLRHISHLQNALNSESDITKRRGISQKVETLIKTLNPTSIAAMINRDHAQGQEKILRSIHLLTMEMRGTSDLSLRRDCSDKIEKLIDRLDGPSLMRFTDESYKPRNETPLEKIERLALEIGATKDPKMQEALRKDLDKTLSALDDKSRHTLQGDTKTMDKIQQNAPQLIRSRGMSMDM